MSIIDGYFELTLKHIANTCREILQDAIQSEVYDRYNPKEYERTYQLLNSVRVDVRGDYIYVYVNTGNMKYTSNKKNSGYPASTWVGYWVQHGHSSDGSRFYYDQTPSRDYVRVAKERIEKELGEYIANVEIIESNF